MKCKRFMVWFVLVAAVALAASGCAVNPTTGGTELRLYSMEEEVAIGGQLRDEVFKQLKPYPDPVLMEYVAEIGHRVAKGAEYKVPYTFHFVDKNEFNAFAMAGGQIFVYKGLLATVESEEQLAMILAHEVAHVSCLHCVGLIEKQNTDALVFAVLDSVSEEPLSENVLVQLLKVSVDAQYSQAHEHEADKYGTLFLARAGYDPAASIRTFELMNKLTGDQESSTTLTYLFGSHPPTPDRVAAAKERLAKGEIKAVARPRTDNSRFLQMKARLIANEKRRAGK
ncbi:MAG: M48 family metalloprotease [Phycisphaerales bacterium]|jgi:beta-barrel assembly-enhancing protease|nr:M48 family metalloprotease [Phycisphaerales bacterium]MBT7171866.1 M48 family metalloprotease [Phycisphaerales bacterium]